MSFLDHISGAFVVQTMLHSTIAVLLSESALVIWGIDGHHARFRYRTATIILPVLIFPVFKLAFPGRNSFYFVHDHALFESRGWFELNLPGNISAGWLALGLVAGVASIVFFLQELRPLFGKLLQSREGAYPLHRVDEEVERLVRDMALELNIIPPELRILEDERPTVFTTGATSPAIVISTGLLNVLTRQQLLATLAHELAHIRRRSNFTTLLIFMIRLVTFYNPVSLLMFRRLVQDDEHVCDDITVRLSGSATALAATLRMFIQDVPEHASGVPEMKQVITDHSHNLLLMERISRLEHMDRLTDESFNLNLFFFIQSVIVAICYFVI